MGIAVMFRNLATPNFFRNGFEDLIGFKKNFDMTLHLGSGYFAAYSLKTEKFYELISNNDKIIKVVIYGGNLESSMGKNGDRVHLSASNGNRIDYKDSWNVNLIWIKKILNNLDVNVEIRIPKDDINWHAKVAVLQCNNTHAKIVGGIVGSSNLTNHAYTKAPSTFNMEADTFIYNPVYKDYFVNRLKKIHRTSSETEKNIEHNEDTHWIEILHSEVNNFNNQDEAEFLKEVINSMQQSTVPI